MVRLGVPGAVAVVLALGACGGSSKPGTSTARSAPSTGTVTTAATAAQTAPRAARPVPTLHPPFAVGMKVMTFTDRSRQVILPGKGAVARTLVTLIRYPASRPPRAWMQEERHQCAAPNFRSWCSGTALP
jgi:hypothetical protein